MNTWPSTAYHMPRCMVQYSLPPICVIFASGYILRRRIAARLEIDTFVKLLVFASQPGFPLSLHVCCERKAIVSLKDHF